MIGTLSQVKNEMILTEVLKCSLCKGQAKYDMDFFKDVGNIIVCPYCAGRLVLDLEEYELNNNPEDVLPMILDGIFIIVDPGHGGEDPGAVGPRGTMEKDVTLPISFFLSDILKNMGADVYLTRSSDSDVSLKERSDMANEKQVDLFVSIHSNGSNQNVEGLEVFYHNNSTLGKILSDSIMKSMIRHFGAEHQIRGSKSDYLVYPDRGFYVLRNIEMPGVLVECEFLTNPNMELLLIQEKEQRKYAKAIADGISKYYNLE